MKHPQALKSTKSLLSISLILLFVAGCSTPDQISVAKNVIDEDKLLKDLQYVSADKLNGTDYMLWSEEDAVKVGDTEQDAISSSGQPSKSFRIRSLPDRFGEDFSSEGWEKGDDVFACILYKDKTVLAMYTKEKIDDEDLTTILDEYKGKYGNPTWKNNQFKTIQFHFWFTDQRMLMISTAIDADDNRSLTVAIGVPQVMKYIGMDPDPKVVTGYIETAQQSLTSQKAAE